MTELNPCKVCGQSDAQHPLFGLVKCWSDTCPNQGKYLTPEQWNAANPIPSVGDEPDDLAKAQARIKALEVVVEYGILDRKKLYAKGRKDMRKELRKVAKGMRIAKSDMLTLMNANRNATLNDFLAKTKEMK
jgi:hypothetical protein